MPFWCAGQRPLGQPLGEADAVDEVHRVEVPAVRLADAVDGDDVRVLQAGRGGRLGAEALQLLLVRRRAGQQHLDGDHPFQARLPRLEDDPHAAAAHLAQQLVVAETLRHRLAGRGRQRGIGKGERRLVAELAGGRR
jgi:hypothetical protein